MKRFVVIAVALFTVPLFAQQQPKNDFQIFVYASNVGIGWTETNGTTVDGQRVLQPVVNKQVGQVLDALDRKVNEAAGKG